PADRALINRMGLNNDGAEAIVRRMPARSRRSIPVGVNIVKTHREGLLGSDALDDFCRCYQTVAPHADYVALNISCPNTAEGKTFEEPAFLDQLLTAIENTEVKQQPLLVKLSPPAATIIDEGRYAELLTVILSHDIDGIVAANTAADRNHLKSDTSLIQQIGRGGLSGRPIAARSTSLIRFLFRKTGGRLPIIGVGGIDSADEAFRKIRAGASLVQLYTGLVYEGPGLVKEIVRGLARHLDRAGKNLNEIVGEDA
ncbi:MAG: dihydroorotate dehydrogenase (quinone), partial [Rhodothermia bacterium]